MARDVVDVARYPAPLAPALPATPAAPAAPVEPAGDDDEAAHGDARQAHGPREVRPLELGANLVVHSLTKFLAGHGDVLGGAVVSDAEHIEALRTLARTYGPLLGPFESYLAMRGIKTFPLRMERQCANAQRVAAWLHQDPRVERVFYPGLASHPDHAVAAAQMSGFERVNPQPGHEYSPRWPT